MYYKLYRRRHYIYAALVFLGIVYLIRNNSTRSSIGTNDEADYLKYKKRKTDEKLVEKIQNVKPRINMQTYVEPKPCNGCPGENGGAVYLTVKIDQFKNLCYFG